MASRDSQQGDGPPGPGSPPGNFNPSQGIGYGSQEDFDPEDTESRDEQIPNVDHDHDSGTSAPGGKGDPTTKK